MDDLITLISSSGLLFRKIFVRAMREKFYGRAHEYMFDEDAHPLNEGDCLQISGLHAVVVCLLLGAVVLVVGLVQLAPGATTTNHRLALLVAGAALLLLGKFS